MQTAIDLMTTSLPLLYGLAAVNYSVYFVRRDVFAERTCTPFLFATFLVHLAFFVVRSLYYERAPITSMPEALSAVALSVCGVYLYVERIQRSRVTGVFLIALVVVVQLLASTLIQHAGEPTAHLVSNPLYGLHAVAAVLGHSALAVGAMYALMHVLLYRALKNKRFGLLFDRLPSLDTLAGMGFGATLLGWILFTVAIGLGFAMSPQMERSPLRDPYTVAAFVVWGVYGVVVLGHYAFGWRGTRLVTLTLFGFIAAVVAVFGAAVWPSLHRFGA